MKVHFIGIGGIGMSALADICLSRGHVVTGSDTRPNNLTDDLSVKGGMVFSRHVSDNVPVDADLVVRSTCIRLDNPEVIRAGKLGIPVILRGEMLKNILSEYENSVSVTGTHGKTTTSGLISHIMEQCGKDPTILIGGEMDQFKGNSKTGKSGIIVAEVDESDGYFRNISSDSAVITNIEREHMEHYGSMENLISSYRRFIGNIRPSGLIVINGEDTVVTDIVSDIHTRKISFGVDGPFDVTCGNFSSSRNIEFDLILHGEFSGRVRSPLIGRYNIMNILGAIAMCVENGCEVDGIVKAICTFYGVRRRFQRIATVKGVEIVEDYAHHPTEVRSVISAARDYSEGRVVTVFQPHRYSRTKDMMKEFSECFYSSDILILTGIYSADEDKIEGPLLERIYESIDKERFEKVEIRDKDKIPEYISSMVREDDIVLILGAGDIRDISPEIVNMLKIK